MNNALAIGRTPWGRADHRSDVAKGIVRVSTSSHGGYYITPAKMADMPAALRAIRSPYVDATHPAVGGFGLGWYEEDCDWIIVALAFPEHFPQDALTAAIAMARNARQPGTSYVAYLAPAGAWLDSDDPRAKQVHYLASLDEISRERYAAALARHDGQPVYGPLAAVARNDAEDAQRGI